MRVAPRSVQVGDRNHYLFELREAFHDDIELSHNYKFTRDEEIHTIPAGKNALVVARCSVGLSQKTLVVVHGEDASESRLLVEIITKTETDKHPLPNGL